jgi:hypothetical protein
MAVLKTISATQCPSAPIDTPLNRVPSARARTALVIVRDSSGNKDGSTLKTPDSEINIKPSNYMLKRRFSGSLSVITLKPGTKTWKIDYSNRLV